MVEEQDYRTVLEKEFGLRSTKNARYSLRAFARDLGLSPASLSLVLKRKQGLSSAAASRIARRLGLTEAETQVFCDLVRSQHARTRKEREIAQIRLRKHQGAPANLTLDAFHAMSDWYHLAILELTTVDGFQSEAKWIAKALDLSPKVVEIAIERLKRLELLEEVDGVLRQTVGFMATPSGIPSEAIKKFHQQILNKAGEALFTQSVEQRDFSTVMFAIDPNDVLWAKDALKEFRRTFMARLEAAPLKKQVYCLSMQFFGLQQFNGSEEGRL